MKEPEDMTNDELIDENEAYYQLQGVGMKDRIRHDEVVREMTLREGR